MELQLQSKPEPVVEVGGGDLERSYVTEVRNVDMAQANDGCCVTVLKRKRGRPAKGNGVLKTTAPPTKHKKDEEDVCFICFDGGSLVLCDRR